MANRTRSEVPHDIVDSEDPKRKVQIDTEGGKVSNDKDVEVLPIEQEAVQGAYHVHLSWRSWVSIYRLLRFPFEYL